ncbi:PTS sugar transporter subunit IIA [Nocardia farcinica]|uniref:PTS fructose transporter subunit IIABC n=1 Tax=Nocardia farcinica TaxID=37329 RepID=UPI0018957ED6|nr:fructose-specific PTS transporter subunit EIIC [Nocardia farcinica]MBF6260710.1 PTS sugar transporter subunit IIA [Nocardia farcinica]MBF6279620.1 PTS sugar transporter subunit IIA [Nocardia farcinica]MBF6303720.1 PTS sugar transporter subunit IIA [Nocardia farcinica]MBF6388762.1 PTS sugar transporter subunit IIA [Nocardia farcinica]MBF6489728.1 PTS sugar transporter subunit IIA [Nocardia farcinica]
MADSIITPATISLDADLGTSKDAVIAALAQRLADAGRATDATALTEAALAREAQSATGLPGGIAIPHCRVAAVTAASLAFARPAPAVDFGAPDGPADLVFLIAAPEGAGAEHMKLLSSLARALVKPEFVGSLRAATTADEVVALVDSVVAPAPAASAAPASGTAAEQAGAANRTASTARNAPEQAASATTAPAPATEPPATTRPRSFVAVTACPTGIAHTYMAADALVAAGERAGVTVRVETQGSSGTTPLSAADIAAADAVILATDVGVKDRARFAGKPVVESGVKRAINEPDAMIADALRVARDPADGPVLTEATREVAPDALGWGTRLRQILLTGVSYMIPFVAAGGLLIALGFLVGGYEIADNASSVVLDNSLTDLPPGGLGTYLGAVLFQLGSLAFSFLVPALAGYIAFAIADRPGLAPGFTAGAVAVFVGAGFLGGLVGGLIAGFAALWVSRIPVPQWARGLMPVVVIPLFASLIVGVLMLAVLGKPLAVVTEALTDWLNGLSGTSAVVLGVILGLMMCFDLGGPVNKAAYSFAAAGLSVADPATLKIMAAVMAAGMVPPLAMALASTVLRPTLFTTAERENGKAAWLLGASFISEGAIPFAAADPLRVIPSMMAGGAVTGALVMATGATLSAPHGGIFVFFAVGHLVWFVLAIAAGTITAAVCVTLAKLLTRPRAEAVPAAA